jgi:hypothetical protein
MAKTSHEIEKEFILSLKHKTGKDLKEWMDMINKKCQEYHTWWQLPMLHK